VTDLKLRVHATFHRVTFPNLVVHGQTVWGLQNLGAPQLCLLELGVAEPLKRLSTMYFTLSDLERRGVTGQNFLADLHNYARI